MALEVKSAHRGILKILLHYPKAFLIGNLSNFPLGLRRFFHARLQPAGCTKQLTEVETTRSVA
jgi:hypothetical protein